MLFRKEKYLFCVYTLILLGIISLIYLFFFNFGIQLNAKLVSDGHKISIDTTITNSSNHIIEGLELYNNNQKIYFIPSLGSKESVNYNFETANESNHIVVKAKNHLSASTILRTTNSSDNTADAKSSQSSTVSFSYNVKYDSFILNNPSKVEINICNKGNSAVLNVAIENSEYFLSVGQNQVIIPANACAQTQFSLVPVNIGSTTITFKISNDYYVKEITQDVKILE